MVKISNNGVCGVDFSPSPAVPHSLAKLLGQQDELDSVSG